MSLRFKSLLIFAAAVSVLFAIVLAFARIVIERQFDDIEVAQTTRQAARFSAEINEELVPLTATAGDWAPWDDLYEFATGRNPRFPEVNLTPRTLANLHLDFLAIYRQSGQLVLLKTAFDADQKPRLTPGNIGAAIQEQPLVPQTNLDHPVAGLIAAKDHLLLVAALPILHSDRSGPPAGTLVIGRIFAPESSDPLDDFAGYHVRILSPPHAPPNAGTAIPPPSVRLIDPLQMAALVPLRDLRDRWIATAELTSARPLHLQAASTIRIFVIGLASAGGILLFVVWYLLDSNVILPIRQLANRLTRARQHDELPTNLGLQGGEELAELARTIEELARTVIRAEAKYRAIVEDQTEFILRYQPNGRITFANEALCRYLDLPRESLLGLDAHRFVADEDIRRVNDAIERLTLEAPVVTLDHRVHFPAGHPSAGSVTWVRRTDRGIFSDTGELREIQCVARDITHTHLTHERLEASEIRYRRLFETASDGIVIVRQSDHVITDANPAFCRLFNHSRLTLVNRHVESLLKFKTPRILRTLDRLLAPDAITREAEIVFNGDAGARHYFEVTSRFYETGGDRVIQLNFRDISLRRRASEELRQLSGHLLRSQDEERRRIARELHDSTAQTLSALQMALTQLTGLGPATTLADAKAGAILADIRSLTDSSLREIRTISYLLHPPLLDEVGLLFALRWYVDGFITRTEIVVRLDVPESLDRLPAEIETAVFRVVQESLSNIHRHSGSRRAWIRLTVENGLIDLVIRDEGRGIATAAPDAAHPSGHPVLGVGIPGMRERMRQFNGALTVESSRRGTTIHATLPLEPDDRLDD
jgi:PAS domain S-box-containing protein